MASSTVVNPPHNSVSACFGFAFPGGYERLIDQDGKFAGAEMNVPRHWQLADAVCRPAIAAAMTLTIMSARPALAQAAPSAPTPKLNPAATQPAAAAPLTPADIARIAIPSIVLIRTPTGQGSGFFAGGDGVILTNYHVIRGAAEAVIVTADGVDHKDVEVIAIDKSLDLAVLRVKSASRKALLLGDSQAAAVGEHVVAIGNPLGLGDTISDGLLSGMRDFGDGVGVLQISAPISPGSSGGPVLNDRGQVIGIATFVVNQGQNLNFAVPINTAKPLLGGTVGKPLSAYLEPGLVRHIPRLPTSTLNGCSLSGMRATYDAIGRAIDLGAPLYNDGHFEATYRIYAGAAREIESTVKGCAGPKAALAAGVANAEKLGDFSAKAWAMRDAFDGLIALVVPDSTPGNGAPVPAPARAKPVLAPTALAGCAAGDLEVLAKEIRAAIAVGAPLFDAGNPDATFRIYAGAVAELDRKVSACPAAITLLDQSLRTADAQPDAATKAWTLRDAFDAVTTAIPHPTPTGKPNP